MKGWFDGRKADALFNEFHGGWNHFVRGDEDEITNADLIQEFVQTEKDNWGFAIDDSSGEMIVSAARDVAFSDCEVKREAAGEMPILHCHQKSALMALAIQFCQVWGCDDFADVFLPGEEFEDGAASQIACILMGVNGLHVDL